MILRSLRRLRFVLLPLYAGAMLAFQARLGWAHDPTCPHHAGHAAPTSAAAPEGHQAASAHAAHMAAGTHGSHAAPAAPAAAADVHAAPGANPDAQDSQCSCLDLDCSPTGGVAVLDADSAPEFVVEALTLDDTSRPAPRSVVRADAYRTHRLPFPHAPPRIDGLS